MELKRKINAQLCEWKNAYDKRPLIIRGPRQCGKTYSVLKFARENYANVVYVNFFEDPECRRAFEGSLKIDEIIFKLSMTMNDAASFVPNETVIVLDEIQDCPNARTALKFFHLDGRFDVICTGSLLGVKGYGKEPRSISVGYENYLTMHPLDFEEFLWAVGVPENVSDYLRERLKLCEPVESVVHEKMREHFLRYAVVGGMPTAVLAYCEKKDIRIVRKIQNDIVTAYKSDMLKYATRDTRSHIMECFESVPAQLGKENKKFQYAFIRKGAKGSTYSGSLQWIEDAGIILRCYNVTLPEVPFEGVQMREAFKVYFNDPGLFMSMLSGDAVSEIVNGNLSIYKGAVYENLMAGILHKNGEKLFYYHKENGIELDFLIARKGKCVPVEIKSTNGNSKSLKTVFNNPDKYHVSRAVKFADANIGLVGALLTLPHYMAYLFNNATESDTL